MAIQALSISLCELSQEQFFMRFLVNLRLLGSYSRNHFRFRQLIILYNTLEDLMELLLRLVESEMNDIVVQQTACIAISQIACYMDFLEDGLPTRIALALNKLLDVNEVHVLSNAICSIRSLGEAKLCHRELLSDEFLWRVANIVVKHKNNRILVKNCVAVLAVFSYDPRAHKGLGEATVMDVLFLTAKADDDLTRELVATTLCNISINTSVRRTMIIKGVAKVLANLSGTTSEIIQHLCATTICNVTCTTDLHSTLISNDILSTILMIAMVRAVAIHTKILCAKSLLNLISEDNAKALKQSGAIRIFSSLSTIDDEETQLMCAKGLLVYTGSTINREDIVQRRAVLLAIYAMVKSCKGKALEMVGLAICNLLSCPQCQHIAIQAGGLAVLKIFSSMNLPVLNDAAARLIINLSSEQSLKPALKKESLVPILVLYLQQSSTNTFRYALAALSSMCHTIDYHPQIIDRGGVSALVNAVISNRVSNTNYSREICRCIGLLSFHTRKVEDMVVHSNVVLALHILHRRALITPDAAVMIAVTFQNLSTDKKSAKYLMQQDGLKLFLNLLKTYPHESLIMYKAAVMFVFNLAQESSLHPDLLTQGIMNLLFQVILISPHFKPMKSTNESAASSRQSTSRGKKNRRSYLQSPDMSSTSLQAPNDSDDDSIVTKKSKNSKLSKLFGVSQNVVEKKLNADSEETTLPQKGKNNKLSKMFGVSETVVEKNKVDTSYDDPQDMAVTPKGKNSKLSKMLGVSETVVEKNVADVSYEDEDSSANTKKSKNSKLSKMLGVSETVVEKNVVDTSYDDDYSDDTTKKKTKNSKLSKMLGVSETVVEKNIVDHNYDDEGFEDEESSSSSKMKAKNSKLSKMFGVSETVVETSQTAPGYDEDNVSTQPKKSKNSKLSKMFGVSQSVVEKNSSRNSFSDDDQDDISLPSNRPSKAKNGLAIPIPHAPVVKLVFRFTKTDIYFISKTLSLMCHTPSCHEGVANGNVIHIFKTLLDDEDNVIAMAKHEMATTLCLLSSSKPCRPGLAKSGATEFAISLAQLSISSETQAKCAVAIGYLSDITALKPTVVTNLLWLQQRQIEQREENTEVTKIRLSDHRLSIGEMEKERISAQLKEYGKDALSVRELMWKAVDTIKKLDKAGTDMSNLNSARSPLRDSKVDFMKNIRDASPELNYIPKSDEYKLFEKAVNEYRNEGMTTIRSARVAVSSSETFYVQVQLKSELSEGGMAPLLRTDTFSLPEIHISDEAYVSSHQSRMKEFVINAPPPHPIEKDRRLLPEYFNVDDTTREAAEEVMAIGLSDYSTSDGGNDDSSRKRTSHSLGSSQPNSARLFAQLSARKFMKDHDDMTSKLHNLGLTANESEKTASDRRDIFDDFLNEVKETPKDKRRSSRRSDRIEKNRLSNSPVKHSFTSNKTHHVNRKKNPKNR
jgi:biotin operon repressor